MDKEKSMIYRCPVCFARENDVSLFRAQSGYYCPRCSFTGSKDDIVAMYGDLKKKYRKMTVRLTAERQREL